MARYQGPRADDKSARLDSYIEEMEGLRPGTDAASQQERLAELDSLAGRAYNVAVGSNGRKARLERAVEASRARLIEGYAK